MSSNIWYAFFLLLSVQWLYAESRLADVCLQPKEEGPCLANKPRYYYNIETGLCGNFTYGGCKGNENNFITLAECQSMCPSRDAACLEPKRKGRCKANIPRYYYNKRLGICKEFTYSGCGGNGNNFITYDECESLCL